VYKLITKTILNLHNTTQHNIVYKFFNKLLLQIIIVITLNYRFTKDFF